MFFDKEWGWYDNRGRPYDPRLGRFSVRDHAGYQDGTNLYEYEGSNPVNCCDPNGERLETRIVIDPKTKQPVFNIDYIRERGGIAWLIWGHDKPVHLGTADLERGYFYFGGGQVALLDEVLKESRASWTDWEGFLEHNWWCWRDPWKNAGDPGKSPGLVGGYNVQFAHDIILSQGEGAASVGRRPEELKNAADQMVLMIRLAEAFYSIAPGALAAQAKSYREAQNLLTLVERARPSATSAEAILELGKSQRRVNLTTKGLEHIKKFHCSGGAGANPGEKSIFNDDVDLVRLLWHAGSRGTRPQYVKTAKHGQKLRYVRAYKLPFNVGTWFRTGLQTRFVTVITELNGNLVTAHPGWPDLPGF